MKKEWSIEEQKGLFQRLGYDTSKYNPDDKEETEKLFRLAISAQLNGVDAQCKPLSLSDLALLSTITGRG